MGIVMKYGGTSVGTINRINKIAAHIAELKKTEKDLVIVVSAMGKSTDELIRMAKQISNDLPRRELDALLSTGEQQTIALLAIALIKQGVKAISLTGFQAGFLTTSSHTKGIIKYLDISRVKAHIDEGKVVVVAGFQGISDSGDITTLGRGGSDTSAVALAARLGYRCEIYTDVDGIYTVDPRVYENAKKLDILSYEELMEMASLGAGVIEKRSVELAKKYNVPLYIAKSLSAKESGTEVINRNFLFEDKLITGISITDNVAMVTLEGSYQGNKNLADIFNLISGENINLDMISQTIDKDFHLTLSFSIDADDVLDVRTIIVNNQDKFSVLSTEISVDLVKISLIGVGMASNFGVAAKVFSTLSNNDIAFYNVSTSEISISCTINKFLKTQAVHVLAEAFNL